MKQLLTPEYFLKEAQTRGFEVDKCSIRTFKTRSLEAILAPIIANDYEFEGDELFKNGVSVIADLIYFEGQFSNPPSGFYRSEFVLNSPNVHLVFKDINTGRNLAYELVFSEERGIHTDGEVDREFERFVFQQYTEWCGRWHQGRLRTWRICTGKDCPGGGICIVWRRKWF
jgi:hypothetical protein